MSASSGTRRRFGDMPLFWKLLVPFLLLIVIVGALGTLLVVRDLASRAEASLNQDLTRRSVEVRTALHDRELYLLESVNFAANLQGVARAIKARDTSAVSGLLESVRALKRDLDLLVVTDVAGRGLVSFVGAQARPSAARDWSGLDVVSRALRETTGGRSSGFVEAGDRTMLAIAGPVCSAGTGCAATGVAMAGIAVDDLIAEALTKSASVAEGASSSGGVSLFDADGSPLAAGGLRAGRPPVRVPDARHLRLTRSEDSVELASLYVPFEVGGRRVGTLAVTVPKAPAFASVRGAGVRVALIVAAVMAGVVAVGALLSRFILGQVRPLLTTSRALGRGDLDARVPVRGDDELGEVARGLNQMAEQLQASHESLESRVAQRTEEVQRLLAERTEFFASMSHEFRTPLGVILNEADMLAEQGRPLTARFARDAARTIRASGDQLLTVINEILDLAQADAGRIEVELEEVRLPQVVKELRSTVEGLARGGDLRISIDVPRDLPAVLADRGRLREVLLNLVDNAVKYTPAGGAVAIAATSNNGSVHLIVSDTGMGIPAEVGERVFEPFYRVKGSKPVRGQASSGLGLALAKRFVEAQGGRIAFISSPGAGSTFTVSLVRAGRGSASPRRRVSGT